MYRERDVYIHIYIYIYTCSVSPLRASGRRLAAYLPSLRLHACFALYLCCCDCG